MIKIGKDIGIAKNIIDNGDTVGIPTETVYGLAANALDEKAVVKIFDIKNRPYFDPLIIHTDTIEKVIHFVEDISPLGYDIATQLWPGPLTMLLPKKDLIPDIVTSGLTNVGVRVPDHSLTLELLSSIEYPLAAPSANPFGYISPTNAQHVIDQLGDTDLKYILDGGECKVGLESTIITVKDREIVVHRLGGVPLETLQKFSTKIITEISGSMPESPGMLDSHYSPSKLLYVGDIEQLLMKYSDKKVFVISFTEGHSSHNIVGCFTLTKTGDINEAAFNLFKALRQADSSEAEIIISEKVDEKGLGRAINDRLARASFR